MAHVRRICILTGSRADYGLLRRLVLETDTSPTAELQLIVTGSHLSPEFGMTSVEIASDRVPVAAEIPLWNGSDGALGVAAQYGAAVAAFAQALEDLAPDVVVVLGDRLEAHAMATAATILSVPLAHIHGGERTEGAMDDSLRHSITKLAYLHFTSTEEHRQRVIQLGEEPSRVFNLGAPVVDALADLELLDRARLAERFGVRFGERTALVTFHPAGMDVLPPLELARELLAALDTVSDLHVIITGTNSDIGGAEIRAEIAAFAVGNPDRVDYVESFGQLGYLSAVAQASVVVGNSSSTVLEAPVLGTPSVLVGDRQAGRPLSPSVLVPAPDRRSIAAAIERASSADFRRGIEGAGLPFGTRGFAARALDRLTSERLPRPPRKRFWDIEKEVQ